MLSYRHLLAGWFALLVGCAGASADPAANGSSADLATSTDKTSVTRSLEAAVREIGAVIEQTSDGNDYLAIESMSDAAFAARVGAVLTGDERSAALLDCAIYGGGRSADPDEDEDLARYIDHDTRVKIAAELDASIGTAKVHRIDAFGVGDIGDDYGARCTVAVEEGAGKYLALQGHGNDSVR